MSSNSSVSATWGIGHPGQIALTVTFGIILLTGILGNLLVIAIILLVKTMRSAVNLCLASLAVADLIVLVFLPTLPLIDLYSLDASSLGKNFCVFVMSIDRGALLCSTLIFLLIAVERYTVLCHPLKTLGMWTPGRVCLLLLLIWVVSVGVSIPYGFFVSYKEHKIDGVNRTYCYTPWLQLKASMSYDTAVIAVAFFLPVPVLMFLYVKMIITLNSQVPESDTQGTGAREARRTRSQVVVMLVIVVVIFVLCNLPFKIQVLLFFYDYDAYVLVDTKVSTIVSWTFRLLLYINHSVNPVIYFSMSANFREGFARLFCRCSADADDTTQPTCRENHTELSNL